MNKKYEVSVNLQQDFTAAEQAQGRNNIGAASASNVTAIEEKMGEVIASALDDLDARVRAIEEAVSATNLGERTADRLDVQTLLVGGKDVTERLSNI